MVLIVCQGIVEELWRGEGDSVEVGGWHLDFGFWHLDLGF
jgi:hypothetical protein